jgi:hypothetical protein
VYAYSVAGLRVNVCSVACIVRICFTRLDNNVKSIVYVMCVVWVMYVRDVRMSLIEN